MYYDPCFVLCVTLYFLSFDCYENTKFTLNALFVLVVSSEPSANKKALKIIKLQERGINVITTTDRLVTFSINKSELI